MIVAEPPECKVCHQGVFGDGDPLNMTCHKSKMCNHFNWDVSDLRPDHSVCRRPLRGIQGKAECKALHRPLPIYWPGFEETPVIPASTWGTTFVKIIDLLHAYGDCWDLETPVIEEGQLFMPFFEWKPPPGETGDDSAMVEEAPGLPAFALEETRSESGMSRSSRATWRSVITNQSWNSIRSWKPSGASRHEAPIPKLHDAPRRSTARTPRPGWPMLELGTRHGLRSKRLVPGRGVVYGGRAFLAS